MDFLENETAIQRELDKLLSLLDQHETVIQFKKIQEQAIGNDRLTALEEKIKQAQKEVVQFEHYDKPEAKNAALLQVEELTEEYDQHPLVVSYRQKLLEVNELLQYVTKAIQLQVNDTIEEEDLNASKN